MIEDPNDRYFRQTSSPSIGKLDKRLTEFLHKLLGGSSLATAAQSLIEGRAVSH